MQDDIFPKGRLIGVTVNGDSLFVNQEGDTVYAPHYNPYFGKASAVKASHIIFWTPQYAWIGFSYLVLLVMVLALKKTKILWFVLWLPYIMVLAVAAAMWPYEGPPHKLALWRAMFWDDAAPTIAALHSMGWVYAVLVPTLACYQWWRKQRKMA